MTGVYHFRTGCLLYCAEKKMNIDISCGGILAELSRARLHGKKKMLT